MDRLAGDAGGIDNDPIRHGAIGCDRRPQADVVVEMRTASHCRRRRSARAPTARTMPTTAASP